jgi:predicted membrane-bound spermidine synthase
MALLFWASGFAALIYQVVWQRALFGIFGVNQESVTLIVSAFMLGLGLGSLAGGALSKWRRPLFLFALAELSVGAFGLVSLPVFRAVGELTQDAPPSLVLAISFLTALVPTLAMGATLPLLVAHGVGRSDEGLSVRRLYFVNTLGSAAAAVVTVAWLLPGLGAARTTWFAALINLIVGGGALLVWRKQAQ